MSLADTFQSAHPPDAVLRAYADEVPAFAASLPMVAEVVELAASADDGTLLRIHRWSADVSRFPRVLTGLLPAHYFQWTTTCRWDRDAREGSWTLNIGVFGDGEHIEGHHRFVPDGTGTRTEVGGRVLVQAARYDRIAGIPVPGPLQRTLDRLIHRVFAEVVARSGEGVERHPHAR